MNNDDVILKYLAEALSEEEKAKFEDELSGDPVAKERFKEIQSKFASIRELSKAQPNNAYFDSIDANSILSAGKKRFAKKVYAGALSFAALILLFFVFKSFYKTGSENFMFSDDDLQVVEQLTEYDLDARIGLLQFAKIDVNQLAENFDEKIIYDNLDRQTFEFYQTYSQTDPYYDVTSGLSEEDFSLAINELNNVKF
ncbi:MAG: hypothetical protein GXO87_10195 [Chlorobi bacterium]|nr:hypothetical protein [Chlorobiota bacterium]